MAGPELTETGVQPVRVMLGSDSSESTRTTDHDEIRNRVEERDGRPVRVESTGDGDGGGGLLRVEFGDELFETFEENDLAFVHQAETSEGAESRFSKLVLREE